MDSVHEKLESFWEDLLRTSMKIACLTNKSTDRNQKFQDRYDIPVYHGIPKKPHPAKFRKILSDFKMVEVPSKALFVDDSLLTGIVGAKSLGMKTVLVDYRDISSFPEMLTKRLIGRPLEALVKRRLNLLFPSQLV